MQHLARTKKGFTLIEVLIVVAIIGILATIVIVSLRETSDRGRNTKIIAAVVQARKIAEDMYVVNGSYESLCDGAGGPSSNSELQTIQMDVAEYGRSLACYSGDYHYCISVLLIGENANYFCIDDQGRNIETTADHCDDIDF
ncbi:MAG: prepilin-type N-terminal cleavage/methylation domain-containing protein, partial [Patescibacteria group bacterium]|nr:prepilin-type N-terminal cleavage/methylation domain-containing protein [Patescibacteria group bacterium]